MITVQPSAQYVTDPEINAALQQIQSVSLLLTSEGNAQTPLIDAANITKFNTALGVLLDYYNELIVVATAPPVLP